MKLGFIGMGAMGSAIAAGALKHDFVKACDLSFSDFGVTPGEHPLTKEFGAQQVASNRELVGSVDAVVIAVKPKHIGTVLTEIAPELGGKLVISIAGGVGLDHLEGWLSPETPIVRVMPNLNAQVNAAMSALCANAAVTPEQKQYALGLFNAVGRTVELEESLFSAFTAIAGCAPAWTYTYVEALAKAGVAAGLTKAAAIESATQMLLGSALMLQDGLEKGAHPGQLVDRVCSPGGSTIAGLLAGEDAGFSRAVVHMVEGAMAGDAKATQK